MPDTAQIRDAIARIADEVLNRRMAEARAEIVDRAAVELESLQTPAAEAAPASDLLNAGLTTIHDAQSQADILRALLEAASYFCGRCALFVVKAGSAAGWQARGFGSDDAVRSMGFSADEGLAGRAVRERVPVTAAAKEFNGDIVQQHGAPVDGNAEVLPLIIKDKVAALLYADSGTGEGRYDSSAVQILVRATSQWIELLALRKGRAAEGEAADSPASAECSSAHVHEEKVEQPTFEPIEAAAAPQLVTQPAAQESAGSPLMPEVAPQKHAAEVAASFQIGEAISAEDEETHKRARRFAKLLVDEIKLYNPTKVAEGRQTKDLYPRLKEDIEKSRATFEKRFGGSPAAGGRYFEAELVRILADNDKSLMGEGYES